MSTGGRAAGRAAEHVIAKAVERAGVRDAEQVAAKGAERVGFRRGVRRIFERDPYRRPSGFRKGVRDDVWNAAKGADGRVRDPLTQRVLRRSERWDMGHQPGHEFRKHQDSARSRGISRKDFLGEHNDPTHYRPELPSSNRGRAGEDRTGQYLGP